MIPKFTFKITTLQIILITDQFVIVSTGPDVYFTQHNTNNSL